MTQYSTARRDRFPKQGGHEPSQRSTPRTLMNPVQKRGRSVTAPRRVALVLGAILAGIASARAHATATVNSHANGAISRAEALIRSGRFGEAATMLGSVIQADPANRRARELLAFAFESSG